MHHANYFEAIDIGEMARAFPTGDAFFSRYVGMSRDELIHHQWTLLKRVLARAQDIPFYQRLWRTTGVTAQDIRHVEDLHLLPTFGKAEIMASIAAHPPFGDHHGRDIPVNGRLLPMIMHATSGTTGSPQPLFFSPRTREAHKLLLARAYLMQGLAPTDVVHSVYGHGPVNGGHYIREAVIHHTPALYFSAGTGIETPSLKQVEYMRDFGATVIVGFADYILRLAQVAHEAGIVPGKDINIRMISGHLSADARDKLSKAWGGAELFDWYGVGDTGLIATEGPDHDGMHVMEDAHLLEICDVETGKPTSSNNSHPSPDDTVGDMVVTCLFSEDIFPIVRFNTHDVTQTLSGDSALKLPFRRIRGFLGRSDNMVKLRGINIYPQALASVLAPLPDFVGEYVCVLTRHQQRDELTVRIECHPPHDPDRVDHYRQHLKAKLGVDVAVDLVPPQSLAALTGVEARQKPIRLIDERHES